MINFTDLTGLAGCTLAVTAMATQLPVVARLPKKHLALLLIVIAAGLATPFGGLPLAAYVRGVTGDLSITTMLFLALAISRSLLGSPLLDARSRSASLMLIALAAAALYPMALGMGLFDPYRLGYGNPWFLGGLLLLALAAYFRRLQLAAFAIALAVLAWSIGWYESSNLWDYLLDPWLAIYALGALLKRGMLVLLKRFLG